MLKRIIFSYFHLNYRFHIKSYVHKKKKFITFRNIPLKSALFWDSVDTDYECKINVYGKKEGLSNEYQYEFEQKMLKHVHDLKNYLREKGWYERDKNREVYWTSSLRSENSGAEFGFKFECIWIKLVLCSHVY